MAWEAWVVRLGREAPRKCSLTALRRRGDLPLRWLRCVPGVPLDLPGCTLLHPDGAPLRLRDGVRPLLLVDSSWRDLPRALRWLRGELHPRRLARPWRTAFPRRSLEFPDPPAGLASVEALHAALVELARRDDRVLDAYPWREEWLRSNAERLSP